MPTDAKFALLEAAQKHTRQLAAIYNQRQAALNLVLKKAGGLIPENVSLKNHAMDVRVTVAEGLDVNLSPTDRGVRKTMGDMPLSRTGNSSSTTAGGNGGGSSSAETDQQQQALWRHTVDGLNLDMFRVRDAGVKLQLAANAHNRADNEFNLFRNGTGSARNGNVNDSSQRYDSSAWGDYYARLLQTSQRADEEAIAAANATANPSGFVRGFDERQQRQGRNNGMVTVEDYVKDCYAGGIECFLPRGANALAELEGL